MPKTIKPIQKEASRELIDKINTEGARRFISIKRDGINENDRTVPVAFSSEEPVEQWWGTEILDHSPESVRLGRLQNSAPVLMDHNSSDQVGVVESPSIDSDRRGRALARYGKGERADEVFNDVVDGIRTKFSVGYIIHKMVLEETGDPDDDGDTDAIYRVTDWEPYEISNVSVPADDTVGVGRSKKQSDILDKIKQAHEERNMAKETEMQPAAPAAPAAPTVNVDEVRKSGETAERERIAEIMDVGERHNQMTLAREFINSGRSADDFCKAVLERMGHADPIQAEAPDIGMTEREIKRFSFIRAMNALANPNDQKAQAAAGFELECSRSAYERTHKEGAGVMVPADVLKRSLDIPNGMDMERALRALVVGTPGSGGYTVATDLLSGSFIELLRNKAVMMQPGMATVLGDLNGNIAIPRQSGAATGYWVAEGVAPTTSQQSVDQVTFSPKTVGTYTDFSRRLLLQSSTDVEMFVRNDLAKVIALAIDLASINGSGTGDEPLGILNTTGIGDVALGTNGGAPTWGSIVDLETQVAIANADIGSLSYVVNAATRGKLKKTFVDSSSNAERVWDIRSPDTPLNGYRANTTNQLPSNLTKGTGTNLSASIFGNFSDLVIAMWGGFELLVDPYSNSTSGTIRIVALQDADVNVRHAASFAACQDMITT